MAELSTKGLNGPQLEAIGKLAFSHDKLYNLAPYLIGMWLDALFLGVLLALWVRWLTTVASTDRAWVKAVVYYLVLLHLGMSAYILAFQIKMFVVGFGEWKSFLDHNWARPAFVINACSRIPCSVFFTHRAWMMWKKNWAIPTCILPMILASGACSVAVTVKYEWMPLPIVARQLYHMSKADSQGSLELATDFALTTLLAIALLRSKTGWSQTDKLISRILRSLVETQTPPTLAAALFVMVTAKWGHTSQVAYFQAAPKIYPICLLIVISSRVDFARDAHRGQTYANDSIELNSTMDDPKGYPNQIRIDRVTNTSTSVQDPAYQPSVPSLNRQPPASPSDSDISDKHMQHESTRDAKAWA